jgi:hypothetical protein
MSFWAAYYKYFFESTSLYKRLSKKSGFDIDIL